MEFLIGIGIEVTPAKLSEGTFLPGVCVRDGGLLVDSGRLVHPGDLLHEAGHLAVLPPLTRRRFGDGRASAVPDMRQLEIRAIGWSYAASLHLGLDPAVVFHAGGYGGRADGLLRSFAAELFFGATDLEDAGMTATKHGPRALGHTSLPTYDQVASLSVLIRERRRSWDARYAWVGAIVRSGVAWRAPDKARSAIAQAA